MQPKGHHANYKELWAELEELLSSAQKDFQKADNPDHPLAVFTFTEQECSRFALINMSCMLHDEESIQDCTYWVSGSTETQEIKNQLMLTSLYLLWNHIMQA